MNSETVTSFKEFFRKHKTLTHLSMSQCELGDLSLAKFCQGLAENSTLRVLSLKENQIGDEGATSLAKAFESGKPKLTSLNLSKNQIRDKGAVALAHAFRNLNLTQRTIKEVDLTNNMIGADGSFYLGEQLRFNPQFVKLALNLNVSIPHSLILQIKQQLKLNALFQQLNHMPNMIKERAFLREETNQANFDKIHKKHHRAQEIFKQLK